MSFLAKLYRVVLRRPAPWPLEKYSFGTLVWKAVRKYLSASVIPFVPFNCLRILGYRIVGYKIGKRVFVGMQCYLDDTVPSNIVLEDDVTISYRVTFATHGPWMSDRKAIVRKGSYIGCNATILGGTEVGYYATVGACALVTKSVPAFSVVVGVPAKVLKTNVTPSGHNDKRIEALKKELKIDESPLSRLDEG